MQYYKITPEEVPIQKGESWWVVNPNEASVKFVLPVGAYTFCTRGLRSFNEGKLYEVTANSEHSGWVTLVSSEEVVEMPYYVFARHFDAQVFLRPEKLNVPNWAQMPKEQVFND